MAIAWAISRISASFMPREVTAGVPTRMPLAWKGLRVSSGTVFLLVVMCAASRASWASLPETFGWLLRRSRRLRKSR